MEERNKCVEKIRDESKDNLLKTVVAPDKPKYKKAVKDLIIQVLSITISNIT